MVIVKNKVLEKEPWVAMELFKAFQKSKEVAYERARQHGAGYLLFLGDDIRRQTEVFGEDPFPLGLKANRKMLEMLFRSSAEQGLTTGLSRVDELIHTSLRET
jgi:4,5-dihydroxyphthalate decarboxylase